MSLRFNRLWHACAAHAQKVQLCHLYFDMHSCCISLVHAADLVTSHRTPSSAARFKERPFRLLSKPSNATRHVTDVPLLYLMRDSTAMCKTRRHGGAEKKLKSTNKRKQFFQYIFHFLERPFAQTTIAIKISVLGTSSALFRRGSLTTALDILWMQAAFARSENFSESV